MFLCPWDSPGKNTGVGCHFLLQGIFPTQESNPGLLHCRQILYQLSYEKSPFWKLEILNQGVGNVGSFWEIAGRICSKLLSWLLVTVGNPCYSSVLTWPSPFVALSLNFPFKDTSQNRWGPALNNELILTWLHLHRPYSQRGSHSQILGS